MAALAIGLLGQSAIATWSLIAVKGIVTTWSSDPLNNALACLTCPSQHLDLVQKDIPKPYLSSVKPFPSKPLSRQMNVYQASIPAKRTLYGLWLVFLTTLV